MKVYANGWSSGTETIEQNVERALKVKEAGYTGLKWDPFPGPWRSFIHREDEDHVVRYVKAMRETLGPDFTLLVEAHRGWRRFTRFGSVSGLLNLISVGTRNHACAII